MKFILTLVDDVELASQKEDWSDKRKELLRLVKEFLLSGKFTSCRRFQMLADMRSKPIRVQAQLLGVSEENVRRMRSGVTTDAFEALGSNVIGVLQYGDELQVSKKLQDLVLLTESCSSAKYFPHELIQSITSVNTDKNVTFPVADCKPELALLYWLSFERYVDLISSVDLERLNFLLRVLNKEIGTTEDRLAILRVLKSADLFEHLKEDDKKLFTFPPERREITD